MQRGLQTMDSFLNEMDGAINDMEIKLTSIDLNNSSVEVHVVDSNHDSCIELFTIPAEGYFLQLKDAESGQRSSFVAEWSEFTLNSLQ